MHDTLSTIQDNTRGSPAATLAAYTYLGLDQVVVEDLPEPDIKVSPVGNASTQLPKGTPCPRYFQVSARFTRMNQKDTPITFLCFQLHFARKVRLGTSVVEKTAEKDVPTAQIWIVYDVVKKPESGGSGQHGLVQHVDIQRCELAYESGAWRTVK